ncbi:hypothetical protein BX265_8600 [Streptomyces sp. TLI_235]|nr:hypothetical protein BX265_8600 [Streptomyces sp. TLI_235]
MGLVIERAGSRCEALNARTRAAGILPQPPDSPDRRGIGPVRDSQHVVDGEHHHQARQRSPERTLLYEVSSRK